LKASAATGVKVRIIAVEKNRNAVVTLRNRIISEKWTNVTLFSADMRSWTPADDSDLVDIMVSELLGSWGDNELSPECLDGAEKCLKSDGISIPTSYTSFLAPISSQKIWSSAREMPNVINHNLLLVQQANYACYYPGVKYAFCCEAQQFLFSLRARPSISIRSSQTRQIGRQYAVEMTNIYFINYFVHQAFLIF